MYGLNHHILPRNIDPIAIRAALDNQINTMCKNNNISLSFDNKINIREATDRFIHEAENVCKSRRNRFLHRTLRNLANRSELKVCKMDKGIGIILLDTSDYFKKLDQIIDDRSRFRKLDYNINVEKLAEHKNAPWIKKESSVATYCRKLKPFIDEKTYWRIHPQGSQPGKMYGMAKNHKENCPMRPVLSAINTPEYYLAKWLEGQLKPYLRDKYSIASSTIFVEEIRKIKPAQTDICVSFDIRSLYTNVPLQEVINDITDTVYSNSAASGFFAKTKVITRTVFKNILKICSESVFLYKENVYQQCDGVAMGSPLAPILANWFVAGIEHKIMDDPKHDPYKPVVYKRYVDDIFAVFRSTTDRDKFFGVLNGTHPNLKFTMETTSPDLPFLDVSVSIKDSAYNTQVFRKPTNTGVLMNFNSMAPRKWKKALTKCLLNRALRLSSSFDFFTSEVETIKSNLKSNGFPDHFVNSICDDFIAQHAINANSFGVSNRWYALSL